MTSRGRGRTWLRVVAAATLIAAAALPSSFPGLRSPAPVLGGSGGCSPASSTCLLFDVTLGGSGFGTYRTIDANGTFTGRIVCEYGNESQSGICGWGYEYPAPGQEPAVVYRLTPDPGSQVCNPSTCFGPADVNDILYLTGNYAELQWRFELIRAVQIDVVVEGAGSGTVTSQPAGIDCPGDCEDLYPSGLLVALTAKPSAGSVFAGWDGDCSGTDKTCAVAPEFLLTVTATFNKKATAAPPTKEPIEEPTEEPTDEPTAEATAVPTALPAASASAVPTEPGMSVSSTVWPSTETAGPTGSPSTAAAGSAGTLPIVAALAIALVILVGGAVFFARRGRSPAG